MMLLADAFLLMAVSLVGRWLQKRDEGPSSSSSVGWRMQYQYDAAQRVRWYSMVGEGGRAARRGR